MTESNDIPPSIASCASGPPIDPSYRINVHFQPDLPYRDTTVIENLAKTKQYHSQFHTGISNGGLIGTSGRIAWEQRLFGDFYASNDPVRSSGIDSPVTADAVVDRPKYGSLAIDENNLYGASPRFGSCYFRLSADTLHRATFCYPDSYLDPNDFGTAQNFNLDLLLRAATVEDPLDRYIEAHVHGPLVIPRDVEAVVLDPSFYGTSVEEAALKLGCPVEWHAGYEVMATDLRGHCEYRGEHIVDVAIDLVGEAGVLTSRIIGSAYRGSSYSQQEIKKVWHYLACFGRSQA